jgi:hypothetical protein
MIILENTFTSAAGGFAGEPLNYTQIIRSDKAAVYERSRDGIVKDYETIKIRIVPSGTVQKFPNGVTKITEDDTENYATTSLWGKIGWSFKNKQAAINKFNELNTAQAGKDDVNEDEPVAVNVASKINNTTFIFPATANFSTKDFAETNKCEYITASLFLKSAVNDGSVKTAGQERRNSRGKLTNLFTKV